MGCPQGHVFDHGIDTLNCPLGGLVQVASLGMGHSVNGAFFVLIGCIPMWLVREVLCHVDILADLVNLEHLGRLVPKLI